MSGVQSAAPTAGGHALAVALMVAWLGHGSYRRLGESDELA